MAVTFANTQGPDNIQCADLFPFYKPGCKKYGDGENGEGLGACVKNEYWPCPQWVETGKLLDQTSKLDILLLTPMHLLYI